MKCNIKPKLKKWRIIGYRGLIIRSGPDFIEHLNERVALEYWKALEGKYKIGDVYYVKEYIDEE